jgi:uncharacterized protein
MLVLTLTGCNATAEYKGVLWQVTDPNSSNPNKALFLFGSIHAVSKHDIVLSRSIKRSLHYSSVLVLEADVERIDIRSLLNTDLKQLIDTNTQEKLVLYFNNIGLSQSQIDKLMHIHPLGIKHYLASNAPLTGQAKALNAPVDFLRYPGIDFHLGNLAKNSNTPIEYLETVQDQVNAWNTVCPGKAEHSAVISETLDYLNGEKKITEKTINAYKALETGNTRLFTDWYLSQATEGSAIYFNEKCSNRPRNSAWKDRIVSLAKSERNVFVAVGISHLIGKNNLLDLLHDEGLVLEEVFE